MVYPPSLAVHPCTHALVIVLQGGSTALHLAVREGHPACARLLLEAGAPVNAKDKVYSTVLQSALTTVVQLPLQQLYNSCTTVVLEWGMGRCTICPLATSPKYAVVRMIRCSAHHHEPPSHGCPSIPPLVRVAALPSCLRRRTAARAP